MEGLRQGIGLHGPAINKRQQQQPAESSATTQQQQQQQQQRYCFSGLPFHEINLNHQQQQQAAAATTTASANNIATYGNGDDDGGSLTDDESLESLYSRRTKLLRMMSNNSDGADDDDEEEEEQHNAALLEYAKRESLRILQSQMNDDNEKDGVVVALQQQQHPTQVLQAYYQKKDGGALVVDEDCYQTLELTNADGRSFFRTSFRCPTATATQEEEEGKPQEEYASSIPFPLLFTTTTTTTNADEQDTDAEALDALKTATKSYFGSEYELIDGLVCFSSKKAAKKSCSFAALLGLGVTGADGSGLQDDSSVVDTTTKSPPTPTTTLMKPSEMFISTLDASPIPVIQMDDGSTVMSSPRKQAKHLLQQQQRFPLWVEQLSHLGVATVDISYRESVVAVPQIAKATQQNKSKKHNSCCLSQKGIPATQICCIMTLHKPINTTVVGAPCSSKRKARASTILLLQEEIQRRQGQQQSLCEVDAEKYTNKKRTTTSATTTAMMMIRAKKQLLGSDANSKMWFAYPTGVPRWATLSSSPSATTKNSSYYYLYELMLVPDKEGEQQQGAVMKTARIGILFRYEIDPFCCGTNGDVEKTNNNKGGEVFIDVPVCLNESSSGVRAQLVHRTLLTLTKKQAAQLTTFNQNVVAGWESYGMVTKRGNKSSLRGTGGDRACYLFAPLLDQGSRNTENHLAIEWGVVRNECRRDWQRLLISSRNGWTGTALVVLAVAVVAYPMIAFNDGPGATNSNPLASVAASLRQQPFQDQDAVIVWCVLVSLTCIVAYHFVSEPKRRFSSNEIKTRFLKHKGTLYVVASADANERSNNSPSKTFPQEANVLPSKNMLGPYTWHPHEPLIWGQRVEKHDGDRQEDEKKERMHLLPELCSVSPVTRDFLSVVRLLPQIMPKLEREISLTVHAKALVQQLLPTKVAKHDVLSSSLVPLLGEATTLHPTRAYESLEFLGDAVLAYYLALQGMANNASLTRACDGLLEFVAKAGSNSELAEACLRIGLPRILLAGPCKWQPTFDGLATTQLQKRGSQRTPVVDTLLGNNKNEIVAVPEKQQSDVVESVLAATYLAVTSTKQGRIDNGDGERKEALAALFVDNLSLPLPSNSGYSATKPAVAACLGSGYPFHLHAQWTDRLDRITDMMTEKDAVRDQLENCTSTLLQVLSQEQVPASAVENLMENPYAKILLQTALFDDNLDSSTVDDSLSFDKSLSFGSRTTMNTSFDDTITTEGGNAASTPTGLLQLAYLRDTLFFVGNYALHLKIAEEVFRKYPEVYPGNLHLLKACAVADDVLAYIMVKTGMHKALYDQSSYTVIDLERRMTAADMEGEALWAERGGWVLEGGMIEFRRRYAAFTNQPVENEDTTASPKYPGLGGGRLCGHPQKLGLEITDELMFSFKSIVGALVLSIGLDGMWEIMRPLFIELLLLSPDELRAEYRTSSTLVKTYTNANRSD